jgi:hypothetical protein
LNGEVIGSWTASKVVEVKRDCPAAAAKVNQTNKHKIN